MLETWVNLLNLYHKQGSINQLFMNLGWPDYCNILLGPDGTYKISTIGANICDIVDFVANIATNIHIMNFVANIDANISECFGCCCKN